MRRFQIYIFLLFAATSAAFSQDPLAPIGRIKLEGETPGGVWAEFLKFSPDNKFLIAVDNNKTLHVIDTSTMRVTTKRSFNMRQWVDDIHIDPDTQRVIAIWLDGKFGDFNLKDPGGDLAGRRLSSDGSVVKSHTSFSADGKFVVASSFCKKDRGANFMELFEVDGMKSVGQQNFDGGVGPVAWRPDGKQFVAARNSRMLSLIDPTTFEVQQEISVLTGDRRETQDTNREIKDIAFGPDGKRLVAAVAGPIQFIDLEKKMKRLVHSDSGVLGLQYSPDGTMVATRGLATSASGSPLLIFDGFTGDMRARLKTSHRGYVGSIDFSPDGKWLAASGQTTGGVEIFSVAAIKANLSPRPLVTELIKYGPTYASVVVPLKTPAEAEADAPADNKPPGEPAKPIETVVVTAKPKIIPLKTGDDTGRVDFLKFSPDSKTVIAGNSDGDLHLVDAAAGAKTKSWIYKKNTSSDVQDIHFNGAKSMVVWNGKDVAMFDILGGPGGDIPGYLELAQGEIELHQGFARFSPDGKKLAISGINWRGDDTRVEGSPFEVYDFATKKLTPIAAPKGDPTGLAFSPNNKEVAVIADGSKVIVFDIATGKPLGNKSRDAGSLIYDLNYSPSGDRLLLTDWKSQWQIQTDEGKIAAGPIGFDANFCQFTPDGKSFIVMGDSKPTMLYLFDAAQTDKPRFIIDSGIQFGENFAVSPNGKWLAVGNIETDNIALFDLAAITGDAAVTTPPPTTGADSDHIVLKAPRADVEKLIFSPDDKTLVAGMGIFYRGGGTSADGHIVTFDLATQKQTNQFGKPNNAVRSLTFHPDNPKLLFSSGVGQELNQWDLTKSPPSQNMLARLKHDNRNLIFTPDGKHLIIGGLFQINIRPTAELAGAGRDLSDSEITSQKVILSPDGKYIAHKDNSKLNILNFEDGSLVSTFPADISTVENPTFMPGSNVIAFQADTNEPTVVFIDVVTKKQVGSIAVPKTLNPKDNSLAEVNARSLAFSPDGKYFVIGSEHGAVFLFEAKTGRPLHKFSDHKLPPDAKGILEEDSASVGSVVFSHDSTRLATGAGDGVIHVYDIASLFKPKPDTTASNSGGGSDPVKPGGDDPMEPTEPKDFPLRTWKTADGKHSIKAALVNVVDRVAELKREDGQTSKVPITLLSERDNEYMRNVLPEAFPEPKYKPRFWTTADGKSRIKASFVSTDGENVTILREDGRKATVPLKILHERDRNYVAGIE